MIDGPVAVPARGGPCAACGKPGPLCVCAAIDPVPVRTRVLVLQHPQEKAEILGTATIAAAQIAGATVRAGLSWRNLAAALGREADARRWAVLYLGPAKAPEGLADPLVAVDKAGAPLPDQGAALAGLEGLVLLDGTWSQAKTLWWRNPWLLKCRRVVLFPKARSRYGTLRREPRREGLSTIEAAALALARIEGDPTIEARIVKPFEALLRKVRAGR
jgi:DTW domain-containing protein YfiP